MSSYSIRMEERNLWKKISSRIVVGLTMIWIYLPIVGNMISLMTWILPALYYSWYLFNYNSEIFHWIEGQVVGYGFPTYLVLIILESIVFVFGFYLLISGIVHLARARKNKINVVKTGPYKYIRHPQHLGIILIIFPFALIIPNVYGIRIANILSFLLNVVILIIVSKIEEINMKQKHTEEYFQYAQQTGFFIPRIRKREFDSDKKYVVKTKKQLALSYSLIVLLNLLSFVFIVGIFYLIIAYTNWIQFVHVR